MNKSRLKKVSEAFKKQDARRSSQNLASSVNNDAASENRLDRAYQSIKSAYQQEYLPEKARYFKTKGSAQDAHEAIRPSDPSLTPQKVKSFLSSDQYRLYKLIWCSSTHKAYNLYVANMIVYN